MVEENSPAAAAAAPVDQQEKPVTENVVASAAEGDAKVEEPPKAEMKAVVLTGFGGLKSVKILKKPEPTIAEGEVVIRVKACGLNFQDLMARQGAIESLPKAPFILGFECSGVIEQVGEGVEKFKVGDRVVALPEWRAWSELVAVPAKNVFAIPEGLNYVDAAALATNYIVAYVLLFELGAVKPGSSLILHSAGGGVGQAVAQLCKTVNNVTVFGVASKTKHEALKGTIDHLLERGSDYAAEVRKVSPEGVDLVLDCVCGEECSRGYNLLKPMGKYILFGSSNIVTGETKSFFSAAKSWWQVDKISPLKLFDENKTLMGFNLRRLLFHQNQSEYVANIYSKVIGLWKDGKVKPVIDSTWAFEDVGEAMQKMHDRKNIGKIVLDPSLEPKPKPATPVKGKSKNADKEKEKKEDDSANGTTTPEATSPTTKEKEKEKESS
ncbi:NAD(P)-binding domain,GroES-like,Polyketide synthase, enoylreductase domain,Alcohol dehydrogenase, N- [Cinara cedri]|uniref:NAD(P)-binding domain,GroES-like,Polyketide synthase, enoylreductase domain,Alcohol dehydrogenase, N n=1 Tax=Cinara cedri TaxID=506608 RepID=A0A5E4M2Y6_9HEMI|nr:NAD(P)-binding domain,GroES-like,Polyketide synthase, enoylreductase domain,Alcohol dehydrogenase, N- [Cinara cedri]